MGRRRFEQRGEGLLAVDATARWAAGAAADFRRAAALAVVHYGHSWDEVAGAATAAGLPRRPDELERDCRGEVEEVRSLADIPVGPADG